MARVLVFFLAFVPVCRAEYYDADEDIDRGESYDRYNEEIEAPLKFTTVTEGLTRFQRRHMGNLSTLSQEKPIVDVKGVLNNILQGDQPDALRGPRNRQQHTDSYSHVENDVRDRAESPTVNDSNRSPGDGKQENTIKSSSKSVTEQHWSFVYQPETSTKVKNDIIAEVRKLQPIKEGKVPRQFSIETWFTTEGTESTIDSNNYPQETTTYNTSKMQGEVKKLVQHWAPATNADNYPQETTTYNSSAMQGEVKMLVQHWAPATNADNYPQKTTTYNISKMQGEAKKLVQHWAPATKADNYPQKVTKYNPSEIQAEVDKLLQHWAPATNADNYPHEVTKYNPSEIQAEVNKLLQHWAPPTNAVNYPQEVTKYNPLEIQAEVNKLLQHWAPATNAVEESSLYYSAVMRHWSPSSSFQDMSTSTRLPHRTDTNRVQHWRWRPAVAKFAIPKMNQQQARMQTVVKELDPYISRFKQEHPELVNFLRLNALDNGRHHARRPRPFVPVHDNPQRSSVVNILIASRTMNARDWNSIATDNQEYLTFNSSHDFETNATKKYIMRAFISSDDFETNASKTYIMRDNPTTTPTGTTTTTLEPTTTLTPQMDINKIIAIIANLTEDYEWNLTEQFNKSLIEHGVPTCPWKGKWGPSGEWTATSSTTTPAYDFENTHIVTKCFVCGLKDERIPENAHCADAFAGDFLPLMPVDARSRGKIAGFRKYCRRLENVTNYIENSNDPRAIYGRFTEGCAVRWTDITPVYTQRTCRIEKRPLRGKHFASKRMAKLELALVGIKNGCIISPMATLLPVSRGISVYARFHACVCTGNWCNRAMLIKVSTNTVVAFVLCWLLHTWPS